RPNLAAIVVILSREGTRSAFVAASRTNVRSSCVRLGIRLFADSKRRRRNDGGVRPSRISGERGKELPSLFLYVRRHRCAVRGPLGAICLVLGSHQAALLRCTCVCGGRSHLGRYQE